MLRRPVVRAFAAALLATSAPLAHAGQVRIDVGVSGNPNVFIPNASSMNLGDHAVWVWGAGTHTVTSGTNGSNAGDGRFNSHPSGFGAMNARFSWKSNVLGAVPYYCTPHFTLGMTGTLNVAGSGVAVSDFRLTEVRYRASGSQDLIEIRNMGAAGGNLGRYRLAISGQPTAEIPLNNVFVAPGGHVVVHLNASGTNTDTDIYLPTIAGLADFGSIGLYVPNTVNTALTDPSQIIDYVEWGAGGQANEATAGSASLWVAGEFVPGVGNDAHSLEFCGTASQRGASFWSEVAVPNFGTNDMCATPTVPTTWGRIKAIYR